MLNASQLQLHAQLHTIFIFLKPLKRLHSPGEPRIVVLNSNLYVPQASCDTKYNILTLL